VTAPAGWAIAIDGRTDPGGIVVVLDEREEAESIASEIRRRGPRVVVRPYPEQPAAP
jgi:hypothetical protein